MLSLNDFLRQQANQQDLEHIVIGNPAGDADSIVSPIGWAFVESFANEACTGSLHTPVVSMLRADLEATRPETSLLLKWASVSSEDLVYIDDRRLLEASKKSYCRVTLVDHNRLVAPPLAGLTENVVGIQDHHVDELQHVNSCKTRNIAFENGAALVASTCTLVVERMATTLSPPFPQQLSTLLLGVILLDSVNLDAGAGKVTERDRTAARLLIDNTAWEHGKPNTDEWFAQLQGAKFDPEFWTSLSVRDVLRLDYKSFVNGELGMSSVLMKMQDFFTKSDVTEGIYDYMIETGIHYLIIMFSHEATEGLLQREVVVCTREVSHEPITKFLQSQPELELGPSCFPVVNSCEGFEMRGYSQGNSKASRKVLAPILLEFFRKT